MDFVECRCCTRCNFIAGISRHIPGIWYTVIDLINYFSLYVLQRTRKELVSSYHPTSGSIDSLAHCHNLARRDLDCLSIP